MNVLFFFLFSSLFLFIQSEDDVCYYSKFDLEFVLDASGSVSDSEFLLLKQFVHGLVERVHVSESFVRVGIVIFSCCGLEHVDTTFEEGSDKDFLLDYTDPSNPNGLERYSRRSGVNTDLAPALQIAKDELFGSGKRKSDKLIILITDGITNEPTQDRYWANELKDEGAVIISIGVGPTNVSALHMKELSSEDDLYFQVDDFSGLDSIVDSINDKLPCGIHPFIQFLLIAPLIFLTCCCCCLLLALLGGLALLFLGMFKVTVHKTPTIIPEHKSILAPVAPILEDEEPIPSAKAAAVIPPKVIVDGGETTESMYYIGGQQTAVNWGNDGINWDTAYRPGDMGMGEKFGKEVGYRRFSKKEGTGQKITKISGQKKEEEIGLKGDDGSDDEYLEDTIDPYERYSTKSGKKRKWCCFL